MYPNPEFISACKCGNLKKVQDLISQMNIKRNFVTNYQAGLVASAQNDKLNVLKYLCSLVQYSSEYEGPFRWACICGNLEIAKYIVSLGFKKYEVAGSVIRTVCYNGHLNILKYLVFLGVKLHQNDGMGFEWACRAGNLEIVKYLVSVGVNIHSDDDYGFRWACYYGRFSVVKYLISLGMEFSNALNFPSGIPYKYEHISVAIYLSNFISNEQNSELMKRCHFHSFHLLLCHFFYAEKWIIRKEDMKENELWDGNIGLIVASFCW